MKTGIEKISEERQKQIDKHDFTAQHHVDHPEWYDKDQLVTAAVALCNFKDKIENSDLHKIYMKICPKNWGQNKWKALLERPYEERLKIAGALLAAELDRIELLKGGRRKT